MINIYLRTIIFYNKVKNLAELTAFYQNFDIMHLLKHVYKYIMLYFYSHLIYGCNIWGLTTEENLNKIEVLQKKCLRIMTFSAFNSHTNQLFSDLKLVKVRDIITPQQLKLVIVYDFYNNVLPTDIQHLFTFSRDTRTTNLHLNCVYKNLLYKPHIKTTMVWYYVDKISLCRFVE